MTVESISISVAARPQRQQDGLVEMFSLVYCHRYRGSVKSYLVEWYPVKGKTIELSTGYRNRIKGSPTKSDYRDSKGLQCKAKGYTSRQEFDIYLDVIIDWLVSNLQTYSWKW